MKTKILRNLKNKFLQDCLSIKLWIVVASIVLLVKNYLTGQVWATVVVALFGMREAQEWNFSQKDVSNGSGE